MNCPEQIFSSAFFWSITVQWRAYICMLIQNSIINSQTVWLKLPARSTTTSCNGASCLFALNGISGSQLNCGASDRDRCLRGDGDNKKGSVNVLIAVRLLVSSRRRRRDHRGWDSTLSITCSGARRLYINNAKLGGAHSFSVCVYSLITRPLRIHKAP